MSFGKLILNAVLCFGVATMLAELAGAAALWARGVWSQEKLVKLAAVANDVNLAELQDRFQQSLAPQRNEHFPFHEVVTARAAAGLDLDLKQLAIDRALDNASFLDALAEREYQKYANLKTQFDRQLRLLRLSEPDAQLVELQRELESMSAKMAKDQLLRLLDNRSLTPSASRQFVAKVLKGMPQDKRKKIVAEFKGEEIDRLYEILQEIRRGAPEAALARQTRQQLQELEPHKPQP